MAQYSEQECEHHGLTIHRKRTDHRYINVWRCKQCENEHSKNHKAKRKQRAIEYAGGSCEVCGYDKCPTALEFHHRDPSEKEFSIGHLISLRWSRLQIELDKCQLLCANCHRELHFNLNK